MKSFLHILAYLFSAVLLLSCEPGRDENGDFLFGVDQNQGNGGGNTAERLLKRMVSHAINDDTGEWEDSDLVYNYEGRKLVSFTSDGGEPTLITYNSGNKISGLSNSAQTAVFTYNGAVLSEISTTVSGFAKINSSFSYTGSQLSKVVSVQEYTLPLPSKIYLETTYEYSGANVSAAKLRSGFYLPNGDLEMNPETQTLSFEYDAKKSPFQLLPKEFILYLTGIAPHGAAYLSANNFIKFSNSVGGFTEVSNYNYTYDAENYPTEMKGDDQEFTKFEYQ